MMNAVAVKQIKTGSSSMLNLLTTAPSEINIAQPQPGSHLSLSFSLPPALLHMAMTDYHGHI